MQLRYRTDGTPSLNAPSPLLESLETRIRIVDLRQIIRMKLDLLDWSCCGKHEFRQKQFEAEGGDFTSPKFPLNVLCPIELRDNYPNCAHVERNGRDPDPYGPEIRELSALHVLDAADWDRWLAEIRFRILAVDTLIGISCHGGLSGVITPLPDGMTPERLQQVNIRELQAAGVTLLAVTSRVLGLPTP